jgi:hypothetical protein
MGQISMEIIRLPGSLLSGNQQLDVLQSAEDTYLRLIPDAERRFPEFEQKLENEFLEKLEAANRAKQGEKARTPGKDDEKVL